MNRSMAFLMIQDRERSILVAVSFNRRSASLSKGKDTVVVMAIFYQKISNKSTLLFRPLISFQLPEGNADDVAGIRIWILG